MKLHEVVQVSEFLTREFGARLPNILKKEINKLIKIDQRNQFPDQGPYKPKLCT